MGRRKDYTLTLAERYESHVDRSGGPNACHPWLLALGREGYGFFSTTAADGSKRTRMPTHVGWELEHGTSVPDGLCVLHRCDNPPCQNPRHWFLGTREENNADKAAKGRHGPRLQGEQHTRAKLTEHDVRAIRAAVEGGASLRGTARRFCVTHRTISLIVERKAWAHVE